MATNNQLNTATTAISVAEGGTGVATMTTAYTPICAGTTATGNLQPVSGTGLANSGWILTSNGAAALPTFQAPVINVLSVPLTATNVLAMYATPFQIIAAQGSNTLIVVYSTILEYIHGGSAFAGGSGSGNGPVLQYGNSAHAAGDLSFISLMDITSASSQVSYGAANNGNNQYPLVLANPSSGAVNQGIYATNDTAAYTGGTGSSLRYTIYYAVLTTTV